MLLRATLLLAAAVSANACVHSEKIAIVDSATIADAAITAAVKTALLNDPRVDGTLVTVTTQSGVVRLGGTQSSRDAAAEVVSIVRGLDGVRDVQSSIAVESDNTADSDAHRR